VLHAKAGQGKNSRKVSLLPFASNFCCKTQVLKKEQNSFFFGALQVEYKIRILMGELLLVFSIIKYWSGPYVKRILVGYPGNGLPDFSV
jgi:hypothetical protein